MFYFLLFERPVVLLMRARAAKRKSFCVIFEITRNASRLVGIGDSW